MRSNFFIDTHVKLCGDLGDDGRVRNRAGTGWENNFTEALGFFLKADQGTLETFCRRVMGDEFEEPVDIETQYSLDHVRPDMAFWLRSGRALLIENKVDAALGEDQLESYLRIRPGGKQPLVALFAPNERPIRKEVWDHLSYKRPDKRPDLQKNFRWTDLYQWIDSGHPAGLGVSGLRYAFREYLELLGFGTVILTGCWRKLYEDRTVEENRRVQEEFGRRLFRVKNALDALGFRVTKVTHKGLRGRSANNAAYLHVIVLPRLARKQYIEQSAAATLRSEVLSVALVYDSREVPAHAKDLYAKVGPEPFGKYGWVRVEPYPMTNGRIRFECVCNLEQFLTDEAQMSERLLEACTEVFDRILK